MIVIDDFYFLYNRSMNDTNFTRACLEPHAITSAQEFFDCYAHLFKFNVPLYTFEIFLILSAAACNSFVIISIYFYSVSYTVFDQILIGHCLIQALTATVDIPFFHFMDVFGYWPLHKAASMVWSIYDNNINTTTNLTVLYMCWARLRSIQQPIKFKDELLIKWPKVVMASIWAFGLGIWAVINLVFRNLPYTTQPNYEPIYLEVIFNIVFWLLPLLAIMAFSVKIISILISHSSRKRRLAVQPPSNRVGVADSKATGEAARTSRENSQPRLRKKSITIKPEIRYMLIIIIYCIQWTIPCITVLVNGLCKCVPNSIYVPIYWLTYTVVLTDPLTILILNPNLRFFWSR